MVACLIHANITSKETKIKYIHINIFLLCNILIQIYIYEILAKLFVCMYIYGMDVTYLFVICNWLWNCCYFMVHLYYQKIDYHKKFILIFFEQNVYWNYSNCYYFLRWKVCISLMSVMCKFVGSFSIFFNVVKFQNFAILKVGERLPQHSWVRICKTK